MTEPVRVVLTRRFPPSFPFDGFSPRVEFEVAPTQEELISAVRDAEVLYSYSIPPNVPSETPQLRWIQLPSAGVDHIRDSPAWDSTVIITSSAGLHTVPMSEHTFAMLLALVRNIPAIVRAQERKEWLRGERLRGSELRGRTMGIIGWGKIGNGVAHLASAFGMRVIGTRYSVTVPREVQPTATAYADPPWLEPEDLLPDIVYPSSNLDEVLAESDVVVLALPLTEQTHRSFTETQFNSMRRGSIFINIGRGPVVDQLALIRALQSGRLAGAALDVYAEEPLPRSSPLWSMPNVIVSPHAGGFSEQAAQRRAAFFAVNLSRYLEGRPLLNVVSRTHGY